MSVIFKTTYRERVYRINSHAIACPNQLKLLVDDGYDGFPLIIRHVRAHTHM
jgi:hypothetical protein